MNGVIEKGIAVPPRRKTSARVSQLREQMRPMEVGDSMWLPKAPGETPHMTQVTTATVAMRLWGQKSYRTAQEINGVGQKGVRVWRMK